MARLSPLKNPWSSPAWKMPKCCFSTWRKREFAARISAAGAMKFAHEAGEGLDGFERHRVVERDAQAADGAVAGRAGQPRRGRFRRELRSEEHTSELQSHSDLVCRLLLE